MFIRIQNLTVMHSKLTLFLAVVLSTIIISTIISCRSEPVIPQVPLVSFSAQVKPLIANKCSAAGCHGTYQARFGLVTYADIRSHVVPGNAHDSRIYNSIISFSGDKRMPPKPVAQLADSDILLIYVWIMQGAKDN
jgi:hypothetical protein